jgi:hypothetical protein
MLKWFGILPSRFFHTTLEAAATARREVRWSLIFNLQADRQADTAKEMPEVPKRVKRQIREWAGIAHDRDLGKALGELRIQFDRWERGEIDSFELNERVHRFHHETSCEIWKRCATPRLEPAVASAVAVGVLRKEELPSELLQHIAGLIEFYEHDLSAS